MKYRYSCRREAGTSVADIEIQIEMVASTSLSTLGAGAGAGAGAVAFVKLSPGNSYSSCSRAAPQLLCGSFGISLKASSSFSLSTSCSVQVRKVLVKSSISSVAADADDFDIPQWHREIFEEFDRLVPTLPEKTWYPKGADAANSKKQWYIVDATDKILGRLASTIAIHIRGKHLPTYTPSMDMGSYVIVVNAEKVAVSGKKRSQKLYRRHSGRPGGMKEETFEQLQKRIPERIVEHAVKGMLPKGRLGRRLFTHLKVYKGPDHPHEAQQPKPLPLPKKRITLEK